jgi:TolB protein
MITGKHWFLPCLLICASILAAGCQEDGEERSTDGMQRYDSAMPLTIALDGSLQNGAWSPEAGSIVFTRFRDGYNQGPADIYTYTPESEMLHLLVSDGSANVNLPGSSWSRVAEAIVFSSSRGRHDEIYFIDDAGSPGDEEAITGRDNYMAYEPSFSPDGQWVVFESHPVDVETQGVITKYRLDHTVAYQALTDPAEDCRQPNWSPMGDMISYQRLAGGQWDIWVMNADGTGKRQVTTGPGDKTDASFSPDGQWIIYSSDQDIEYANLFVIPAQGGETIRVTDYDGYDGAPSWGSDGRIVFESYAGDPDDSAGTTLWVIDAPRL